MGRSGSRIGIIRKSRMPDITGEVIAELQQYLSPGDAVLDIGAQTGDTSVLYALAVGPDGRVFAVEPNPYVLPVLECNASLNAQAAPIEVPPVAATAEDCKLTFNYSDPGYNNGGDLSQFNRLKHGHLYPLEVEGRNLHAVLRDSAPGWLNRIRLIKTDTEGNDHAVLLTLEKLIRQVRPMLLCEIYKQTSAEQRLSLYRYVTDELGYECYVAELHRKLKGEKLSEDSMTHRVHFDMFCLPA